MGLLDQLKRQLINKVSDGVSDAVQKAVKNAKNTTKTFTFNELPRTLEALKTLPEADLKDPFAVAALTVLALDVFSEDRAECLKMIDFLNGPNSVGGSTEQFLRDRFMDGQNYKLRSYMEGAVPENNYTPSKPYVIKVSDNPYSRENEGYITLWLQSGGADSPREIQLRNKPSTGEWFVNVYEGLLLSMRIPKEQDPWA